MAVIETLSQKKHENNNKTNYAPSCPDGQAPANWYKQPWHSQKNHPMKTIITTGAVRTNDPRPFNYEIKKQSL
jgi:hypothetical protein